MDLRAWRLTDEIQPTPEESHKPIPLRLLLAEHGGHGRAGGQDGQQPQEIPAVEDEQHQSGQHQTSGPAGLGALPPTLSRIGSNTAINSPWQWGSASLRLPALACWRPRRRGCSGHEKAGAPLQQGPAVRCSGDAILRPENDKSICRRPVRISQPSQASSSQLKPNAMGDLLVQAKQHPPEEITGRQADDQHNGQALPPWGHWASGRRVSQQSGEHHQQRGQQLHNRSSQPTGCTIAGSTVTCSSAWGQRRALKSHW